MSSESERLRDLAGRINRYGYPGAAAAIIHAADHIEALTDALEALADEQNGPPLDRRIDQWNEVMDKANRLLGRSTK